MGSEEIAATVAIRQQADHGEVCLYQSGPGNPSISHTNQSVKGLLYSGVTRLILVSSQLYPFSSESSTTQVYNTILLNNTSTTGWRIWSSPEHEVLLNNTSTPGWRTWSTAEHEVLLNNTSTPGWRTWCTPGWRTWSTPAHEVLDVEHEILLDEAEPSPSRTSDLPRQRADEVSSESCDLGADELAGVEESEGVMCVMLPVHRSLGSSAPR